MVQHSGSDQQSWWKKAAGTIFGGAFSKGWKQWLLLLAAVFVIINALYLWRSGIDYRKDPSALIPRSVYFYAETRDLDALFKEVGSWPLWVADRRNAEDERWNRLQEDAAGVLSGTVGGLGRRIPLLWLSGASNAAFCVTESERPGALTWALYLRMDNPGSLLSEIAVEPGVVMETVSGTREDGVFSISSAGSSLFAASAGPWLVISSDGKLPSFAAEKKTAFSLAASELLPKWTRSQTVRGMLNPSQFSSMTGIESLLPIQSWIYPDSRIAFTAALTKRGPVEARFSIAQLNEAVSGGIWPLIHFICMLLGIPALILAAVIILVMAGWGGWLKAAAVKAGISPASGPASVTPSAAFSEDVGASESSSMINSYDDLQDNVQIVPTSFVSSIEDSPAAENVNPDSIT